MKIKPFYTNRFGLHTLYNGVNKIYLHELTGKTHQYVADEKGRLALVELPVAREETSLLRKQFHSRQASSSKKHRVANSNPSRPATSLPLSPVESLQ